MKQCETKTCCLTHPWSSCNTRYFVSICNMQCNIHRFQGWGCGYLWEPWFCQSQSTGFFSSSTFQIPLCQSNLGSNEEKTLQSIVLCLNRVDTDKLGQLPFFLPRNYYTTINLHLTLSLRHLECFLLKYERKNNHIKERIWWRIKTHCHVQLTGVASQAQA